MILSSDTTVLPIALKVENSCSFFLKDDECVVKILKGDMDMKDGMISLESRVE